MKIGITSLEKCNVNKIVIPCNSITFMIKRLQRNTKIEIINLLEKALNSISNNGIERVCILGSTQLWKDKLYLNINNNIKFFEINEIEQKRLSDVIENFCFSNLTTDDYNFVFHLIDKIKESGCENILLACTELPLILKNYPNKTNFINPTDVMIDYLMESKK